MEREIDTSIPSVYRRTVLVCCAGIAAVTLAASAVAAFARGPFLPVSADPALYATFAVLGVVALPMPLLLRRRIRPDRINPDLLSIQSLGLREVLNAGVPGAVDLAQASVGAVFRVWIAGLPIVLGALARMMGVQSWVFWCLAIESVTQWLLVFPRLDTWRNDNRTALMLRVQQWRRADGASAP